MREMPSARTVDLSRLEQEFARVDALLSDPSATLAKSRKIRNTASN